MVSASATITMVTMVRQPIVTLHVTQTHRKCVEARGQTVFTKSPLQAWTEMHMSVLTNGRHVNVPVGCDMVLMIPSQTGLK